MDQREVETMIKALQKALNEKEPSANIITILEKLKKDVAPTEDLLRVRSLTTPCSRAYSL
jgi:transcription elongation factor S-II